MKKLLIAIAATALALPVFAQTAAPGRLAVIEVQRILTTSVAGNLRVIFSVPRRRVQVGFGAHSGRPVIPTRGSG